MPPFHVEYRCFYRDYWYQDENEVYSLAVAIAMATALQLATGRRTRIADETGRVIVPDIVPLRT